MSLNTTSTFGLLGGHTWKYGVTGGDGSIDELVVEGKLVNSIAGSNEKAGLTRVHNSTALTSPSTADNVTEYNRARDLARSFLAYKKKKK